MAEHCDEVRQISKGDEIALTTTNGETIEGVCDDKQKHNADPRSGEIRETTLWMIETGATLIVFSIVEGLKSSPDDPEFPVHKRAWDNEEEEGMGYIESVKYP